MNTKKRQFNAEAERLYVIEQYTLEEISNRLHLNRKTVMHWKEVGDWALKRKKYLQSKQLFHEEMYEFARKMLKNISADIEAGERVDPGRMYAFTRIISMFTKVKSYEDIIKPPKEKPTSKTLKPDTIAKIEEEVLGIVPNDYSIPNEEE